MLQEFHKQPEVDLQKTDRVIITAKQIDPLIINVEQKIGVTPDYEKNLALVNAMQTDVKNYGERNHHGKGHHNRQICDWGA